MHNPIKTIFLILVGIVALGLTVGPVWLKSPEGMPDAAAQRALAVFVLCLALWFTHAIPLAITGLLAFALLSGLSVMPTSSVLAHFGNEAVFFMLGVFFLAAAMIATGLSKRLTLLLIKRSDKRPRTLFVGILCSSSFLALWMPEHAVAAMMFPIVLEIVQAAGRQNRRYAQLLFMGLAWGAVIGGVGTFLGGARAPLAVTLLNEYHNTKIEFLDWAMAAVPVAVVLTAVAALVLPAIIKAPPIDVSGVTELIDRQVDDLGPMRPREWRLAVLGLATIAGWIFLGDGIGVEIIAIGSACLLFVLHIVSWRELQDYINWGILLMYGGAIAIGAALHDTEALSLVVNRIPWAQMPPPVVLLLVALTSVLLTECISNAATVAVLLPIGFSICAQTDINPVAVTFAVTLPAGLPFCLPVSSPPHAIAFSAGYYGIREAARPGVLMDLLAIIVFGMVMMLYWPLIGLSLVVDGQ